MEDITPLLPSDAVAFLRIADDHRRFQFRPITNGLFLIGQGSACDLRLGTKDFPPIHSVVQMRNNESIILRVATHPELLLNGEAVDRAPLQHGDLIELGDFRLVFSLCHPETAINENGTQEKTMELLEPSALISGLESELEMVQTQDSPRQRIEDLLKATQKAVEACQFADTLSFADFATQRSIADPPRHELEEALLRRLDSHHSRLSEICQVLEHVVRQHQMIAAALQSIAVRLDEFKPGSQSGTLRASA